ncbi:hypothetical protein C1J01_41600 [Nonomuraea aridisoli]|uniref:Uncharacterized protein n=1 Tax=Nonomuraea aridisoli TaxID=2070368 RepID=A0A2W2E0Q3_9ACTN|nr:hypothetical protein C1J01_41600 [Nonomuraea aridisoli]
MRATGSVPMNYCDGVPHRALPSEGRNLSGRMAAHCPAVVTGTGTRRGSAGDADPAGFLGFM